MILSNRDLHAALDAGDLVIDPEPTPRFPTAGVPSPYGTSAVNLRLGSRLLIPKPNKPFSFDLLGGEISPFLTEVYEDVEIHPTGGFTLPARQFVLGNTMERISLPIREGRPCYAARIEGRSSFARIGLIIHFTAPTIHGGFDGTITLEMINLGSYPISLHRGIQVCQLIVEPLSSTPFLNPSRFQGQSRPAGA
jgi:dCTP deaminase